jgi:hypothetical protein
MGLIRAVEYRELGPLRDQAGHWELEPPRAQAERREAEPLRAQAECREQEEQEPEEHREPAGRGATLDVKSLAIVSRSILAGLESAWLGHATSASGTRMKTAGSMPFAVDQTATI